MTDCLFESNNAENIDGGGLNIRGEGRDSYLKGCIFKSNTAHNNGGAVCIDGSGLYVDNCNFENNWAGYSGGAICAARVYINTAQSENESYNTCFKGNSVSNTNIDHNRGGAIYVSDGGRIVNTYFKDNTAKVYGGAIYSDEYSGLTIDHCLFYDNSASSSVYQCHGGAICSGQDVYVHNSIFEDNYADDYGGAIYAKNVRINHDREMETADTFFINNKAKKMMAGQYMQKKTYLQETSHS